MRQPPQEREEEAEQAKGHFWLGGRLMDIVNALVNDLSTIEFSL